MALGEREREDDAWFFVSALRHVLCLILVTVLSGRDNSLRFTHHTSEAHGLSKATRSAGRCLDQNLGPSLFRVCSFVTADL